jgi:hypothetical protein
LNLTFSSITTRRDISNQTSGLKEDVSVTMRDGAPEKITMVVQQDIL